MSIISFQPTHLFDQTQFNKKNPSDDLQQHPKQASTEVNIDNQINIDQEYNQEEHSQRESMEDPDQQQEEAQVEKGQFKSYRFTIAAQEDEPAVNDVQLDDHD